MGNLGKNLQTILRERNLTQAELAARSGVDAATINRVLQGKTAWVSDSLTKIATALGMHEAELLSDYEIAEPKLLTSSIGTRRVRLLHWEQMADFNAIEVKGTAGMFLLTDGDYSEQAFAVKIPDDSNMPRFLEGDAVIIDPKMEPRPNDFVAAVCNGEAVFRRYKSRGLRAGSPAFELIPLNDGYPSLHSADLSIQILGVMVEHRQYRRS